MQGMPRSVSSRSAFAKALNCSNVARKAVPTSFCERIEARFAYSDRWFYSSEIFKPLENETNGRAAVASRVADLFNRQASRLTRLEHGKRDIKSDAAIPNPALLVNAAKQLQQLNCLIRFVVIDRGDHVGIITFGRTS